MRSSTSPNRPGVDFLAVLLVDGVELRADREVFDWSFRLEVFPVAALRDRTAEDGRVCLQAADNNRHVRYHLLNLVISHTGVTDFRHQDFLCPLFLRALAPLRGFFARNPIPPGAWYLVGYFPSGSVIKSSVSGTGKKAT